MGQGSDSFSAFHEIIPGIGAFILRPDYAGQAVAAISDSISKVIPNPSMYELSIENLRGTARIEVLDALGKQVYEGEVSSQGMKTRQQLDIRHVAAGVYNLRLQTSDGPKVLRLKKE